MQPFYSSCYQQYTSNELMLFIIYVTSILILQNTQNLSAPTLHAFNPLWTLSIHLNTGGGRKQGLFFLTDPHHKIIFLIRQIYLWLPNRQISRKFEFPFTPWQLIVHLDCLKLKQIVNISVNCWNYTEAIYYNQDYR